MHVKAFVEWQGFKSDFPCLFPGKTCLSKGATSMTSWRTPSQPLGLTCRCEQTKLSKHPVLWFCSTTRCKKPLSTLSIKNGYWRNRPHAASLAQVMGAGLWWKAAPSEGDSVIMLCPAPWAHCCRWRQTQTCWCQREAVTVGSEFMNLTSMGGGEAC